ncbi:MAG: S46 family peptidase [Candidatus Udaeobacter sp.]
MRSKFQGRLLIGFAPTRDAQDEIKKQAYSDIAKARFALEGTGSYPDATFTLRLSYGTVRGYEQDGKQIPAFTDFAGLYQRSAEHDNKPPFDLPRQWIDKKPGLNLATHFDFVSDADIIGGNSGSPVVDKANEFVGIIFDGNIQSLVLDGIYTDASTRRVGRFRSHHRSTPQSLRRRRAGG